MCPILTARQVSICRDPPGAEGLAKAPGVMALALKNLQNPQPDDRDLWLKVIRRAGIPKARRPICPSPHTSLAHSPSPPPPPSPRCPTAGTSCSRPRGASRRCTGKASCRSWRPPQQPSAGCPPTRRSRSSWCGRFSAPAAEELPSAHNTIGDSASARACALPASVTRVRPVRLPQLSVSEEIRLYIQRERAQNPGGGAPAPAGGRRAE